MSGDQFTVEQDMVAADVQRPAQARGIVILAHGAGSDRHSAILTVVAASLVQRGLAVARIDLPYRQDRPKGPPASSKAARDRDGIRAAVAALRNVADGPLIVGGHSYGGRQASMLAAEDPDLVDGLLLTSYPLHPPGKPERARTEHLPDITAPTLIVHGRSDSFGTSAEFAEALSLFTAPVRLLEVEKADHSLKPDRSGVGESTGDAVTEWLLPLAEERSARR
ncbi:alpha/beta hydrolase family protein [Gordonia hydrophobica]|uniref:Alpha/beta fold hydrolase n=1 Tax=Gordonia hydrophobica TaxID=40516 RepID=A0ABZ2TY41_9ACTN|nr:alpha/beta fold hydrolase [Gordonia hydrophobica]MBM7366488.1 putative alpha/beta-hydrolase family hydrolase [Gordonia hydrophobica]